MTVMYTDDRGAVRVSGELPAVRLGDLGRMVADSLALPGNAGTEALVLDLSGTEECDPALGAELLRALLVCAEHDAGLRVVPSEAVRRVLAGHGRPSASVENDVAGSTSAKSIP